MLFSIGEILVDVFDDGSSRLVLPGGAPFNVAVNAALYTPKVGFIGAVGKDEEGELLLREASAHKGLTSYVKQLDEFSTSKAIVTLKEGERYFRFDREEGADYRLGLEDIDFSLFGSGDVVHIGSLMLSYLEGREFFYALVGKLREIPGVKISFDINYRDDIFPDSAFAKDVFLNALKEADVLKFSIEELLFLSGKPTLEEACESLLSKEQTAVITLGKDGSTLYHDGKFTHVASYAVKPVDTTGAGDAFYSYFLSSLVNDPDFLNDKEKIVTRLCRANVVGALATQKKGAIGVAPKEEDIDAFLASRA